MVTLIYIILYSQYVYYNNVCRCANSNKNIMLKFTKTMECSINIFSSSERCLVG